MTRRRCIWLPRWARRWSRCSGRPCPRRGSVRAGPATDPGRDTWLPPLLGPRPRVCPLGHHRCMRDLPVEQVAGRWPPWRRRRIALRYVLGIDIGGTNLVVGCVAEDGSALHGLASEPTHAEAGASDVVDRLMALAQRSIEETRREVPGAEILGVGRGRARPAGHHARHRAAHAQSRLGQLSAAPDHPRPAGPATPRWTTTPTAPCWASGGWARPGARGTPSGSPSAPESAAGSSSTASCSTAPPTAPARSATRRSTPRVAAANAATTAVWRPTPRAPTSPSARWRRSRRARRAGWRQCVNGDLRPHHRADGLRGGARRRRAGARGGRTTPRGFSAPASPTCSTSSIPRSWWCAAASPRPATTCSCRSGGRSPAGRSSRPSRPAASCPAS